MIYLMHIFRFILIEDNLINNIYCMNLVLWWLLIFLILFLFRNKIKNTIYAYTVFLILFYIWSFIFFDVDWKNSMEMAAEFFKIFPYIILWIWVICVILVNDLFNNNHFISSKNKYLMQNRLALWLIIFIFLYFIFQFFI